MSGVVISTPTMSRLRELPHAYDEIAGFLVGFTYLQTGDDYFFTTVMSGRGPPSHVTVDLRRRQAMGTALRGMSNGKFMEFHTHSLGTVREYGQIFARDISRGQGDEATILAQPTGYRHMLVTPEVARLFKRTQAGIGEIGFSEQDFYGQEKLEGAFQGYYERVRQRMGIPEFQRPQRIA